MSMFRKSKLFKHWGKKDEQNNNINENQMRETEVEDMRKLLVQKKNVMDNYFETCSIDSGFREVMDNRQMGKDFWLFDFAKLLDYSALQRVEKVEIVQQLLDGFAVKNSMSAEEHYKKYGFKCCLQSIHESLFRF